MIMPYKDNFYNGRKGISFENPSYFGKAKDLRPSLYDERVIGLGYTLVFLTHSNEALEIEKFKRARENKIEFAYDYGNLNASFQTSSLKPDVLIVILKKIIIDLEDEVYGTLMRQTKKLMDINIDALYNILKQNQRDVNDALGYKKKAVVVTSDPLALVAEKTKVSKQKEKVKVQTESEGSDDDDIKYYDNSTNYGLLVNNGDDQEIFHDAIESASENFNENHIDSQKDCDDSEVNHNDSKENDHLVDKDTQSAHACNNARNAYCNSYDVDVNDLFVFDDVSLRQSHVTKMPFRKKPSASLNVPSRRCSKHMTGDRDLLTHFVEKFLGTVSFSNNDFTVIAGYGDVVIGSMTIKKVYYVEGGVDLLTVDRLSNLYTITLNEVASNSLACLLANASSLQSWLWHQRLLHLNFTIINNLVKNNLVQGLPKMKFEKDHLCSACEQGKIHRKHHKSKTAFALNKLLYLLHMDLYGPMCVESINGKRYVLVVVDDYSWYTWVFFLHSKDEASELIISFIKKTQVNIQLQV
nr:hypothetical protein [Tanacetum cinerariifolium]